MTEPELAWTALRASYIATMGAGITTWWNGIAMPSIESELTQDEVIIHGGIGDLGGFRADFLISSQAGGTMRDGDLVCSYPHIKASLMLIGVGEGEEGLLIESRTPGDWGNLIAITLTDPEADSSALSIIARGREISVSLATDGAGAITTTGAQLKTAIEANAQAHVLVSATVVLGDTLVAMPQAYLEGGEGKTAWLLGPRRETNFKLGSIVCGEPRNK